MNDNRQKDEKRIDDRGSFDDGKGDFIARGNEKRNGESEKQGNGETERNDGGTEGRIETGRKDWGTGGLGDLGTVGRKEELKRGGKT